MHVKWINAFQSHKVSVYLGDLSLTTPTTKKNKSIAPSTGFLRRQVSDMFARVYYLSPSISSRNGDRLADLPIWVVVCDRYSKSIALDIPTKAILRSSSISPHLLGRTPSTNPIQNTTGNSKCLELWMVIRETPSFSFRFCSLNEAL